jgi:hypothetical protein
LEKLVVICIFNNPDPDVAPAIGAKFAEKPLPATTLSSKIWLASSEDVYRTKLVSNKKIDLVPSYVYDIILFVVDTDDAFSISRMTRTIAI